MFENQDDPIRNQDPRKKTEHRSTGTDLSGRQIRTTLLEIKIFAKRRNIKSLEQIFWVDETGRTNRELRSSQKDGTSHDLDRSSWATNQEDQIFVKYSIEWPSQHKGAIEIRRTVIATSKRTRKTLKHKSIYAQRLYVVRIIHFERISRLTRKVVLNHTQ